MLYSVLFRFGHIRRWDQCAVYILYCKISTDPGLLKIRHSHRFVTAVCVLFLMYIIGFQRNFRTITASFSAGKRKQFVVSDMLRFWYSWFKYTFIKIDYNIARALVLSNSHCVIMNQISMDARPRSIKAGRLYVGR